MTDVVSDGPGTGVREHLALVLDADDLVAALRLARDLKPWFGVAKVGLELFSASGPDAIGPLIDLGYDVFLDLKLHDIPTTVNKASRVLGALGVSYVTMHAHGGVDMLRAGVEGLAEGSGNAGLAQPTALAVTVLTSDRGAPAHILGQRVASAVEGKCGGVVCAAADAQEAKQMAPRLMVAVTGIRAEGTETHDQARAATPQEAFDAGADLVVIGRAVTLAADRAAAAEALLAGLT
jgi:orotidine-5'-phosphate decarboxylase